MDYKPLTALFTYFMFTVCAVAQEHGFPIPLPGDGDDKTPIPICDIFPEACVPDAGGLMADGLIDVATLQSIREQSDKVLELFDVDHAFASATTPGQLVVAQPQRAFLGAGYVWIVSPELDGSVTAVSSSSGSSPDLDIVPICEIFPICEVPQATARYEQSELPKIDQSSENWQVLLSDETHVLGLKANSVSIMDGIIAISPSEGTTAKFGLRK